MLAASAVAAAPPAPDGWVTDQSGMLSAGTRAALDRRLEAYQQRTGHQVIVWIGDTTGGEALEPWAAKTFQAWGIGRKGHDDGVAILVLARDRRMRIEVGYGLEGQLTDLAAAAIIRERMAPLLRQGNPDGAVVAAVNGVLAVLGGEDPAAARDTAVAAPQAPAGGGTNVVVLVVGMVIFLALFATNPRAAAWTLFTMGAGGRGSGSGRSGSSWGGGGGGFSGGGGRSGGGGASGSW